MHIELYLLYDNRYRICLQILYIKYFIKYNLYIIGNYKINKISNLHGKFYLNIF